MNMPHADMQAVVVIHGMGEQIPMDTIKSFVDAVWQKDTDIAANGLPHPTEVWSKPDVRTGSLELRRTTTRESIASPQFPNGVRTDFYELYWADLTAGATWDALKSWVFGLLLRPLRRVPPSVRFAWLVLWLATLLVAVLAILAVLPASMWKETRFASLSDWQWLLGAVAVAITALIHRMGTSTFGRVVRYTRADPNNIAARTAVRERGLKLLRTLHDGPHYKRIVIVAHSLGTMLAHDLLSYFWTEREAARTVNEGTPEFMALCSLEHAAAHLEKTPADARRLAEYVAAQGKLRRLLSARPGPAANQADPRWLISDLVTFGSPLTHAEFLIAADRADLEVRKAARELPQSPPYRELLDPNVLERAQETADMAIADLGGEPRLMSYPLVNRNHTWMLHHAAPFAPVRWTNVYDPATLVFFGDVIGGPLRAVFGPGIVDVDLKVRRGDRQSWTFTHTKYWALDAESRIKACREAINLLDSP
jgi:hypothetical protein